MKKSLQLIFLLLLPAMSQAELYLAENEAAVLAAAREIISQDTFMTFITVDESGQPRARTLQHSPPDENMVMYFSTIPGTRKTEQIESNPKVTLHFDGPGDTSYVSIMGHATVHSDVETILKHDWRDDAGRDRFWPDFPEGYVLIRVTPEWLEVVHPDIKSRDKDWRPQAVRF